VSKSHLRPDGAGRQQVVVSQAFSAAKTAEERSCASCIAVALQPAVCARRRHRNGDLSFECRIRNRSMHAVGVTRTNALRTRLC
jgi:hypothetical protein